MERAKLGISGMDKLLHGGIPKNNILLVSGSAGTGKSIFALGFLYYGAKNFGEPGVYISTEQTPKDLINQSKLFGWNLDSLIKKKKLQLVKLEITERKDYLEEIKKIVTKMKAKRLVIDSLTTLTEFLTPIEIKNKKGTGLFNIMENIYPIPITESIAAKSILIKLFENIKILDCTTIVTSELPEQSNFFSRDTVSEFLSDGIIVMYHYGVGRESFRSLKIIKLRNSDHEKDYVLFNIVDGKGIVIHEEKDIKV